MILDLLLLTASIVSAGFVFIGTVVLPDLF